MTIRLNGWHWLWIVLCALWAVAIAIVLYLAWPALQQLRAERWRIAWRWALVWLVPSLALYALGWAIASVRRGFMKGV
jgi:hypothetical protein